MPFRKFFDRGTKSEPAPSPVDEPALDADESEDDDANSDGDAEETPYVGWRERAEAVLPMGASTGSKRTEALYGGADADGPTHFAQAVGCRVVDAEGNEYVDCSMA